MQPYKKKQRYEAKYLAKVEKTTANDESEKWAWLDNEQYHEITLIDFLKNFKEKKQ